MNERSIDKKTVAINVRLDLIEKVLKTFKKTGDVGNGMAFVRAFEAATKGVPLTVEEERKIDNERRANYQRRMKARENRTRRSA